MISEQAGRALNLITGIETCREADAHFWAQMVTWIVMDLDEAADERAAARIADALSDMWDKLPAKGAPRIGEPSTRRAPAALADTNMQRSARAALRDADLARQALERAGSWCCPEYRQVAEARIADPGATWAEVGDRLGLTKDQVIGRFRRLLVQAGVTSA